MKIYGSGIPGNVFADVSAIKVKIQSLISVVKLLILLSIALVLGLLALSLLFADLAPGESFAIRMLELVILLVLSGLLIGFFSPRRWALSALVAWGSVLLGLLGLLSDQGNRIQALILLTLPLCLALASGYAGAVLNKSKVFWKLFKRGNQK